MEKFPVSENRNNSELEKALDIIVSREIFNKRPKLEDFSDVWGQEKVGKDIKYLDRIKKKIETNKSEDIIEKKGEALEILSSYFIENLNWLGQGAHATRTSEFDDIVHGIDMIAEFEPDSEDKEIERLGLAIDAYSGKSLTNLEKKAKRFIGAVKGETDVNTGKSITDTVARVDYFQSRIKDNDGNKYKGGLENLPPVAIALSGENADELFKISADLMSAENTAISLHYRENKGESLTPVEQELLEKSIEKVKKLRGQISKHSAKELFIRQIKKQLDIYLGVASENPNINDKFLENIKNAQNRIEALIDEEIELGELQKDLEKIEQIFQDLK